MNAKVLQALRPSPVQYKEGSPAKALPYAVLVLDGADAIAFLQGQVTQDLRSLQPGDWRRAALCTAQGRVLGLPKVLAVPGGLWMVLPTERAEAVRAHLQRFVMRAKVRLSVADHLTVFGAQALDADTGEAVRTLVLSPTRQLRLQPADAPPPAGAMDWASWLQACVADGEPEVFDASSECWTPHMLAQDRWDAISLTKGCYTGQEIVARTHYLGKNKRQLQTVSWTLAEGVALPQPGDAFDLPDGRRGEWVMGVADGEAAAGLAVAAAAELPG
jgi:folate-binding protein YgfZ